MNTDELLAQVNAVELVLLALISVLSDKGALTADALAEMEAAATETLGIMDCTTATLASIGAARTREATARIFRLLRKTG